MTTSSDAGLLGASDDQHLDFARSEDRIVVTHDEDFLALAASGVEHAGICYCHQGNRSIREIIDSLSLLNECCQSEEMRNRVEYL